MSSYAKLVVDVRVLGMTFWKSLSTYELSKRKLVRKTYAKLIFKLKKLYLLNSYLIVTVIK